MIAMNTKDEEQREAAFAETGGMLEGRNSESGRVGYFVLYLLGAPIGLVLLLWVVLGDNIFGAG